MNEQAKYSPLQSLARKAKRQNMDMQCDPQWVIDLSAERDTLHELLEEAQDIGDTLLSRFDVVVAERDALRSALEQIIHDLPTRRDWLDPTLEQRARDLLGGGNQ